MVPFTRQTLFFSATMPPEITRLTETFLSNPARVEVARASSTATTITQGLIPTRREASDKRETLRRLLRSAADLKNAIVFCNRKTDVAIVFKSLQKHGFAVGALHGDMDQRARMISLDAFKNGAIEVLVCSDVAARGLDIPDVSHVYNYDVPTHPEDYVHRIGRTGRAGRLGTALTLVSPPEQKYIDAIEKLINRKIDVLEAMIGEDEARGEETAEPRRSRSRGKPEGRAPRERRAAATPIEAEIQPKAAPRPAPRQPVNAQPDIQPMRSQQQRFERKPYPRDDDGPPVGFTDHIPSFLLRPVKLKKTAEAD